MTGSSADTAIRASLKTAEALTAREIHAWRNALDAALEPSPFLSPDFLRLAARFRPGARALVARRHNAPVAFAALELCGPGLARPLAPRLNEVQGFVTVPGAPAAMLRADNLLRLAGVRAFGFSAASAACPMLGDRAEETEPDYLVDLSEGFDAFYEEKKRTRKKLVQTAERLSRKLAREVGPLSFTLRDPDPAAVDALVQWKTPKLARAGYLNVFKAAWPRLMLEQAAANSTDARLTALISTLRAGDRLAAVNVNLRDGPCMQGWFMAFDPELRAYSPGLTTLFQVAQAAAASGVRHWRLGTGESDYKERLASRVISVGRGVVTVGPVTGAVMAMVRGVETIAAATPFERMGQLPRRVWRKLEERSLFGA